MLDEVEFAEIESIYRKAFYKRLDGNPLQDSKMAGRFQLVLDAYERMTGFRETNIKAIWHHQLAQYGPACATCGKPLRTPQASQCMACGAARGA